MAKMGPNGICSLEVGESSKKLKRGFSWASKLGTATTIETGKKKTKINTNTFSFDLCFIAQPFTLIDQHTIVIL